MYSQPSPHNSQPLPPQNETSASTSDSELVRYQCRKYGDNKQEKLPPHLLPGDILNCWEYTSDEEAARAITGPNTMFIRNLSQVRAPIGGAGGSRTFLGPARGA